jgi:NNP family nitrate/nitrite transporter-like MFS transporter
VVSVTVHQERPSSGARPRHTASPAVVLAVATVGLGLNAKAWLLLGPYLYRRADFTIAQYAILIGIPVLVAALVRLPVGVLTDRYGARVMLPAISLAGAAAMAGLALAGPLPAVALAGGAAGVAGAAYVVGAALVAQTFPYGRRGLALGIFSLGPVVAAVVTAVLWRLDADARYHAEAVAGSLLVLAGIAALTLPGPAGAHPGSAARRCLEMIRLASTTSLSLLYALALGSVLSVAVYLPVHLAVEFRLAIPRIATIGGLLVMMSAVARLVGGWWTDRRPTARLLVVSYLAAAGLCVALALEPSRWAVAAPLVAGIAVCEGLASGALLALIGKAGRADSVGAVMGVTAAVGALGGLAVPALIAGVYAATGSPAAAWLAIAVVLTGAAVYVRAHGLRVGLGLAVRTEAVAGPPTMTIAVVGQSDTRLGGAAVVARLAELAASDELVVVCGADDRSRPPPAAAHALVTGLRHRLPRHSVAALRIAGDSGDPGVPEHDALLLHEAMETGAVAVALTPPTRLPDVAAELSSYLRADRVLRVSFTLADGAGIHPVWNRGPATSTDR